MKKNKESESEPEKSKSSSEIIKQFDSDTEKGLSGKQVKKIREKEGWNTIEEEEESWILKLLKNFWGPIPWMLEAASVLSGIAGRWEDFGVILFMLLINGAVSFWHENKAENAIQALKEKLSPTARVIRDGKKKEIDSSELVPGDIVVIRMGDVVPADLVLLSGEHTSIDESALTGESVPVEKKEDEQAWSGTSVKRGEARGVVMATGRDTKFARTVELVEKAEDKSHFQKAVLKIGKFLIGITFVLVAVIVVTGLIRNDKTMQVVIFALVVLIAGIPQALPAVLSVTMTIGARRLARMKAIVSRLSAMEEMAGLEVLCADKTGTLTLNELKLQEPQLIDADDEHDLILAAALTCEREDTEDPIDLAILGALDDTSELDDYSIKDFRPFNPTDKRAEADVEKDGDKFTVANGGPPGDPQRYPDHAHRL